MKNVLNGKGSGNFISAVGFGVVIGYVSVFIMITLFAFALILLDAGSGTTGVFATVALALSGLFSGFAAAKKLGSRALIVGLAAGFAYYISVAVISAAVTKSGFSSLFILRLALTLAMSGVGSFLSTIRKKSKSVI